MTPKSIIDSVKDNIDHFKKNLANARPRPKLSTSPAWLHRPSPLLYNLVLHDVADALDADLLWQHGGNVQGQNKPRQAGLRTALQDHPTGIGRKVNGNPFYSITFEVFSDVAVWISDELWHDQSLGGYETLFVMAEKLQFLHANDFKGELQLHQNRKPHYSIMPMAGLARDQVLCQFGLGVFIPGPEDRQTGILHIHTAQNQSHALPDWWFYEKSAAHLPVEKIARPAAYYEQQYSLLIGNSLDDAAIHSPVWLEQGPGGYILVDSRTYPVNFKADGKRVEAGVSTENNGSSDCPFHAKHAPEDALSLRITPVGGGQNTLNSTTFVDDGSPQHALSSYTFVDTDPEEAKIDYALCLNALALPKTRALPGNSRYWVMSFDSYGFPATTPGETAWQLRGDVNGNLAWKMATEQVWQATALPTAGMDVPLPIACEMPLHLQPSPLPDYLALYPLPSPLVLGGLGDGHCTLGREADITLDCLARPDSLSDNTGADTLNNLRFSRQHLSLALQDGQLDLTRLSVAAPAYIQQNGAAFHDLAVNDRTALSPDDQVIVGCYVLHFKSLITG